MRLTKSDHQDDVRELFVRGLSALRLDLDQRSLSNLLSYFEMLCSWSRKINLIGKNQSREQIVENHFLDSLMLLPVLESQGCRLADVGTGAGFPGLVCKVARPEIELVLIEPRLKRVSFLKHVVRTLGLSGVDVRADRIEDMGALPPLSCITSRAVAEIEPFVRMLLGLVDAHTRIACMKGPRWQQELAQAESMLKQNGLVLEQCFEFCLPFSGVARAILVFRRRATG